MQAKEENWRALSVCVRAGAADMSAVVTKHGSRSVLLPSLAAGLAVGDVANT